MYFGKDKPTTWDVDLPRSGLDEVITLQADLIDTWNMTIDRVPGTFKMKADGRYRIKADPPARIPMPGKPYQAIRLKAVKP